MDLILSLESLTTLMLQTILIVLTLESDADLTLEPFDEEDYNLTYSTGAIESLNNQKLTVSGRTVTLSNLSVGSDTGATLTVTLKKVNVKPKNKVYKRCSVYTVTNSKTTSGIGMTTIQDGLTLSNQYGTRVQDKRISIGVPDVSSVVAVLESSSTSDPQFPSIVLTELNTNLLNSLTGETIIGQNSGAAAVLVDNNGSNQVDFVYLNENILRLMKVIFEESNVTATISSVVPGDRYCR